jgi:hypothetical protein
VGLRTGKRHRAETPGCHRLIFGITRPATPFAWVCVVASNI